jgi:CsoR family transcriptional regulator, copper-sensing transcriptional repressor
VPSGSGNPWLLRSRSTGIYPPGVCYPLGVSTTPTRGYTASKQQLLSRLARVEGQVRGVSRMVEEDRYCIDVLTQISAVQAALEKIALGLLDGHARVCMQGDGGAPTDPDEQVTELMGAVGRLVKR